MKLEAILVSAVWATCCVRHADAFTTPQHGRHRQRGTRVMGARRPPYSPKARDEGNRSRLMPSSILLLDEDDDDDDDILGRDKGSGGIAAEDDDDDGECKSFSVDVDEKSPVRIDRFLASIMSDRTRSALEELFDAGFVRLNGKPARKSSKVVAGDLVDVRLRTRASLTVDPEDIPLDILYEDEHLIAVNKPPGMVVHPAPGNWHGTFVNALLGHMVTTGSQLEIVEGLESRPGVVHRLDKGTSGVLIAAKTARAHSGLSQLFSSRQVNKTYLTVSVGNPGVGVEIDVPIGRHPLNRQKMAVAAATVGSESADMLMPKGSPFPAVGRTALSHVDTLAFDGKLSVVQVRIETGRTHQIRVHMQHRRTPVLGDELYGNKQWNSKAASRFGVVRPMLHALSLELVHPVTGERLSFTAPVPPDMMKVVQTIWPQVRDSDGPTWAKTNESDSK